MEGNRNVTQRIQNLGWQFLRYVPVDLAHEKEWLVVMAVDPDRDLSPGFQQTGQTAESFLAIRGVVQHSNAVNVIESSFGEWQIEDASLNDLNVWPALQIGISCL